MEQPTFSKVKILLLALIPVIVIAGIIFAASQNKTPKSGQSSKPIDTLKAKDLSIIGRMEHAPSGDLGFGLPSGHELG